MPILHEIYERIAAYLRKVQSATLCDVIMHIFGPALGSIIIARLSTPFFFSQILPFSEFLRLLESGEISKVVCSTNALSVTLKRDRQQQYRTLVPNFVSHDRLWSILNSARSVEISASSIERIGKQIFDNVMTIAPIAYLIFACYFMKKMLDGKKDEIDAEPQNDGNNETVRFSDVAGIGEAKSELQSLVDHLIV